jgi:hypothetical protein
MPFVLDDADITRSKMEQTNKKMLERAFFLLLAYQQESNGKQ